MQITRMHSSRMSTVRCSCSGRLGGGGGVCLGAVCPGRGCVCVSGGYTPSLWTEFLTHACENITFLQLLLWMVISKILSSESFTRWLVGAQGHARVRECDNTIRRPPPPQILGQKLFKGKSNFLKAKATTKVTLRTTNK